FSDSSATSPFWAIAEWRTSTHGEGWVAKLPYGRFDLGRGLDDMHTLGVRYYLAENPELRKQAAANPGLVSRGRAGPYEVFEVRDASVVSPLRYSPAVLRDAPDFDKLMVDYSQVDGYADVPIARNGPDGWPRATSLQSVPKRALPSVQVKNVRVDDDSVRFD